jgi:hypothetical protein
MESGKSCKKDPGKYLNNRRAVRETLLSLFCKFCGSLRQGVPNDYERSASINAKSNRKGTAGGAEMVNPKSGFARAPKVPKSRYASLLIRAGAMSHSAAKPSKNDLHGTGSHVPRKPWHDDRAR